MRHLRQIKRCQKKNILEVKIFVATDGWLVSPWERQYRQSRGVQGGIWAFMGRFRERGGKLPLAIASQDWLKGVKCIFPKCIFSTCIFPKSFFSKVGILRVTIY